VDKVPGDLPLVGQEQSLQLADVQELPTVRQRAGWIHRPGQGEGEGLAVLAEPRIGRSPAQGPVLLAPAAEHIEALQSEARRIDLRVAAGAGGDGPVLLQLFADGGRAADVRLHGRDAGRRRGKRLAQDPLHHPGPPQDR